jgi:flagellar hook-length control protein FliK
MANDSVGAIPFLSTSSSSLSARDNATDALFDPSTAASSQPNDSFTMALNSASKNAMREDQDREYNDSISAADARNRNPSMAQRADKPKVGNHEPFFPHKPMPYHRDSEDRSKDSSSAVNPMAAQAAQTRPVSHAMSADDVSEVHDEIGDIDDAGIRGDAPVRGTLRGGGVMASGDSADGIPGGMDDKQGVMNQSYDGMAVSYPVKRIASESLDENTKNALKAKGLWNAPTMVMANPSAKLAAMSKISSQAGGVQVAKPIAQFMASLENELGVSPDRLVQAFQQLPPGQLMKSPEQTMVQVIKNLGLGSEDTAKALNLYSKMLAQMQMMDGNDKLANASLIGGGLTAAKVEGQIENAISAKADSNENAGKTGDLEEFGGHLPQSAALMHEATGRGISPMDAKAQGAQGQSNLSSAADQGNLDVSKYGLKKVDAQFSGRAMAQMQGMNQMQTGSQNGQQLAQQFGGGNAFAQAQAQMVGARHEGSVKDQVKFDLKHDLAANDLKSLGQANVTNDASQVQMQGPQNDLKNLQGLGATASTGAAHEMKLNAQARNDAIQTIMNHTQSLAAKGGGEMKLTLRPDHLGEIQLKVAMLDGNRVNVQLTTEKSEVKKLIEQSVHELRHGLAQHNLSMDKIDVNLSKQDMGSFQRGQPDLNQSRDFAQQFQQQQQHNTRREIMDGFAAMRSMGGPRMGADMAHRAESIQTMARNMGTSSRLNVVA